MSRRVRWLVPLFGALVGVVMVASPGLASTAGTWTPTNPMELARAFFTANLLRNGDVLVAGGYDGTSGNKEFRSTEIWHAATGTWSPAANMRSVRAAAVSVDPPG